MRCEKAFHHTAKPPTLVPNSLSRSKSPFSCGCVRVPNAAVHNMTAPSKREELRHPRRSLAPGHTSVGPKKLSRLEGYPQGPRWSHHQEKAKKTNLLAASLLRPEQDDCGEGSLGGDKLHNFPPEKSRQFRLTALRYNSCATQRHHGYSTLSHTTTCIQLLRQEGLISAASHILLYMHWC